MGSGEMEETVPSAIASASIVGAGVLGLVFAQVDHTRTSKTSIQDRRLARFDPEATYSSPLSRPATSAVDRNAYSNNSDPLPILKSGIPTPETRGSRSRRNTATGFASHLFTRRRKGFEEPTLEEESTVDRKESVSSRGSWLKRLSTVPNSQISSPRSSIGPESPSIAFSNGSTAPILSTSGSPTQFPPNKLVKRASSRPVRNGSPVPHKELSYSPPSLRRPATSHQRTATLQQQFRLDEGSASGAQSRSHNPALQTIPLDFLQPKSHSYWTHHFVPRVKRQMNKDISPRDKLRIDGHSQSFYTITRRILPTSITPPTLITTKMMTQDHAANLTVDHSYANIISAEQLHSSEESSPEQLDSNDLSNHRRPRRSMSRHFSPPPSWALRTRSISRRKRRSMENSDSDRFSSTPITASYIPQHQSIIKRHVSLKHPSTGQDDGDIKPIPRTQGRPARKRNCSSPLPPLTPISSFALDLAQIGSSSSSSNAPTGNHAMHENNPMQNPATSQSAGQSVQFSSSPPVSATTHSKLHRAPEIAPSDRSTLVGSDNEIRGIFSGEDEDTDFQSDTNYDSFRTGTTGSLRIQNPLETMFDAALSSGVSKNNMASLGDGTVLSSFHEGPNNISEEEEYVPTPDKNGQPFKADFEPPIDLELSTGQTYPSSPPALSMVDEDFGRLSLEDDDDDDDWAREAEEFYVRNSLSPPSNSMHSRAGSPSFRAGSGDLTSENSLENHSPARPYSNMFEWSESHTEKKQHVDLLKRPKTEHGMQGTDSASGRRRGPTSLLLRTHSVPVVPDDVMGHSKSSKMTEDWGDDFFEQSNTGPDSAIAILIPPAIQASQANVLGHVGLIRDVLPIVNELKRLCSLARDKELLDGPHASLWKEAEGIIALASPDDTDQVTPPPVSPTTIDFDHDTIDDRYRDCGFDGEDLDRPGEVLNNNCTPPETILDTTTVRRRSVFLPDDDIFGHSTDTSVGSPTRGHFSEKTVDAKMTKPATFPRVLGKDPATVARSVMETMHQYRSISDPLHSDLAMKSPNRMPFDTTSLRDFVNRANNLIKILNEIIRTIDGVSQVSRRSPHRAESPAFTRVFTDPMASPPRRLPHTKSSTSNPGGSTDSSPTTIHGNRIHLMTVV